MRAARCEACLSTADRPGRRSARAAPLIRARRSTRSGAYVSHPEPSALFESGGFAPFSRWKTAAQHNRHCWRGAADAVQRAAASRRLGGLRHPTERTARHAPCGVATMMHGTEQLATRNNMQNHTHTHATPPPPQKKYTHTYAHTRARTHVHTPFFLGAIVMRRAKWGRRGRWGRERCCVYGARGFEVTAPYWSQSIRRTRQRRR